MALPGRGWPGRGPPSMMRQRKAAPASTPTTTPPPIPVAYASGGGFIGWLRAPVPASPLLFFRSCWACCVAKELYDEVPRLPSQYGPGTFNFKYHLLAIETPSLDTVYALFGLLFVALAYLAVSPWLAALSCRCRPPHWFGRVACAAVLCGYGFVFLLEAQRYNNHYYLSILIAGWLSLAPVSTSSGSHGARSQHLTVPRWQLDALRWQIATVYFFGGVAKLSDDWLSGATWYSLGRSSEHGSAAALIKTTSELLDTVGAPDCWRSERAAAQLLSWGGAIFDLGVGPLLLAPSRLLVWMGVLVATVFHVSNLLSFTIGVFPVTMLCTGPFYLGFPSPAMAATLRISAPPSSSLTETVANGSRTRTGKLRPEGGSAPHAEADTRVKGRTMRDGRQKGRRTAVCEGIAAALAVSQLLLPLRSYLYGPPAQTLWTQDGSHFSWRMMTHSVQFLQCSFTIVPNDNIDSPPTVLELPQLVQLGLTETRVVELCANPLQMHQLARALRLMYTKAPATATGVSRAKGATVSGPIPPRVLVDSWLSVNGPPFARLVEPTVDLGAADSNVLLANGWVRPRSLRYRSSEWRETIGEIEDYWGERGYNLLGPVELSPAEEKQMVVGMPPGADQPNWFYVVLLDGGGGTGAVVEPVEPLPSRSTLQPPPLRRAELLRRVHKSHSWYMRDALTVGAGQGFAVRAGDRDGALWMCVIPRTAQTELQLELDAELEIETAGVTEALSLASPPPMPRMEKVEVVEVEHDKERLEQTRTPMKEEEQRSAKRTTVDGNTISTNSNDAELGGFTITLAAPSLDETVAEESNRQKQELDQNYVQQRHDDAQDAEDAGEQEELQAAGSEMQSGNAEDAVVNALNVQDNPHEAGSFLVELPPGTRSGNLVRAMLPSLTGELCHIACFDP